MNKVENTINNIKALFDQGWVGLATSLGIKPAFLAVVQRLAKFVKVRAVHATRFGSGTGGL